MHKPEASGQTVRKAENTGNFKDVEVSLQKDKVLVRENITAATKKSDKMKETRIGKNILSILAAILVLVGVAILIASVWNILEDIYKFAIIFAVGVILQLVGTYGFLKKDLKTAGITLK